MKKRPVFSLYSSNDKKKYRASTKIITSFCVKTGKFSDRLIKLRLIKCTRSLCNCFYTLKVPHRYTMHSKKTNVFGQFLVGQMIRTANFLLKNYVYKKEIYTQNFAGRSTMKLHRNAVSNFFILFINNNRFGARIVWAIGYVIPVILCFILCIESEVGMGA